MFNERERKIMELSVDKCGDKLITQCIQEMAELTQALTKYQLGDLNLANIIEEIGDVKITTEELIILFNTKYNNINSGVDRSICRKLERVVVRYDLEVVNEKY